MVSSSFSLSSLSSSYRASSHGRSPDCTDFFGGRRFEDTRDPLREGTGADTAFDVLSPSEFNTPSVGCAKCLYSGAILCSLIAS